MTTYEEMKEYAGPGRAALAVRLSKATGQPLTWRLLDGFTQQPVADCRADVRKAEAAARRAARHTRR